MSYTRQVQAYKENDVLTADSGTVLLKLYGGAIEYLHGAKTWLEGGNMAEKGKCLLRAYDIITELQVALDFEVGGELAVNLDRLYSYMLNQITIANVKNDPKPLETIVSLLTTLRHGWEEAVVAQRKNTAHETL